MVVRLEICSALQAQCRCKICCAFTTSLKRKMEPPFGFRLSITYRAIHNIGLYNWHLQKGIAEAPLMYTSISMYGYTLQSRRARCKAIHLYTVYPYTHYNTIRKISLYLVYANTGYTPIRCGCAYAYRLILFHSV